MGRRKTPAIEERIVPETGPSRCTILSPRRFMIGNSRLNGTDTAARPPSLGHNGFQAPSAFAPEVVGGDKTAKLRVWLLRLAEWVPDQQICE
ncbi:hypothetical protein CKAH01_07293 [Colletotrichum kahawae]|uniref:Uncharacterized protein n=1 Tax=Colletotrichum kahawae TaxID=34407 RepID=A0AAD9Y6B7_COLKA|nr:hypothetical protein CKAH01_07293 [Colletotrichum kahawae]